MSQAEQTEIQRYLEWQHERDRELMRNYVNNHPKLKQFIDACIEAQEAMSGGRRVELNIAAGKIIDDEFHKYLSNELCNPIIMIDSFQKETGKKIPLVSIIKNSPVAEIALNDVRNISSDSDAEDDDKCSTYVFELNYEDNFNYLIEIRIYKEK